MNVRKQAGLWLAVGVIACGAGWGLRERIVGGTASTPASALHAGAPRAALRLPGNATLHSPQPIHIDAALARRAMRDGELRIALPDGTTYPVHMDRQFTDTTGHWNVVGHAKTPIGAQAMVLTFGPDAVFGVIPKPDGSLMHVTTGPGGKVSIAPAGELVPDVPGAQDKTDVRIPPRRSSTPQTAQASTHKPAPHVSAASQPERIATQAATRTAPIATTAIASAAPIDMTPMRIDVLALYSQDLVALRGSKAAAETEVANLFALANQAHVASGTRVTLNPVGVQQITVEVGVDNDAILDLIANRAIGVDLEALRDTYSADLATIIRPYQTDDFSCGVAWLQGEGMQRNNNLTPSMAYSVVNVAPCDPYVLAHELGHSMGSMHDRASSTDPDTGDLTYGAYAFSFGHRTRKARTIMAYSSGQPRIGQFSNPASMACGSACGIAERMDNARSINLMAPSIAMFRGTTGTASIGDVEVVEGRVWGSRYAVVPVYLSAPVPAGTIVEFDVQIVGGTATLNVDYEISGAYLVQIPAGDRYGALYVTVRGDEDIEPDETIQLRIVPRSGTTVVDDTATVTIVADDPRPVVRGKLWFPPGEPVPTQSTWIEFYGADGFDERVYSQSVYVYPPDFTYEIPAAYGSPLRIVRMPTGPNGEYALIPQHVYEVREDLEVPVMFRKTWLLSGQIKAAAGTTLPDYPWVPLHVRETTKGVERYQATLSMKAPDYRYAIRVAEGATLELTHTAQLSTADVPVDYQTVFQNFEPKDQVFNPLLSRLPSLFVFGPEHVPEGAQFPVIVQLSDYAGANGVSFRYRTVDGTAKAGTDYVAASGTVRIEAGEYYKFIDLQLPPANTKPGRPKYFDVTIDQITGATGATTTVRTWISDDDRRTGGVLPPSAQ